MISVDDLSVALADLLIPEEGIFPASCEITGPVIMAVNVVQERLSVLAAPRMVRSTFLFARLRSAGGVYLSGGLKPATETSRILTYPPLIEAGVFPTEINRLPHQVRRIHVSESDDIPISHT